MGAKASGVLMVEGCSFTSAIAASSAPTYTAPSKWVMSCGDGLGQHVFFVPEDDTPTEIAPDKEGDQVDAAEDQVDELHDQERASGTDLAADLERLIFDEETYEDLAFLEELPTSFAADAEAEADTEVAAYSFSQGLHQEMFVTTMSKINVFSHDGPLRSNLPRGNRRGDPTMFVSTCGHCGAHSSYRLQEENLSERIPCRVEGCSKTFKHAASERPRHRDTHAWVPMSNIHMSP
ncbi:uncharacterized protein BDV17DRAFT_258857 [Aspergillus undulatus]|uniref:uncharacterized protein n=1 Tax=Aspergillus undulatus TaxID=1810928 RepID=UPI003CCCEC66